MGTGMKLGGAYALGCTAVAAAGAALTTDYSALGAVLGGFLLLTAGAAFAARKLYAVPAAELKEWAVKISEGDLDARHGLKPEALDGLAGTMDAVQEKLRGTTGYLHAVLNGLPLPCATVDPDQHITFLNHECLQMMALDRDPKEYYGRNLSQVFYKDDREALIKWCMDNNRKRHNIDAVFKADDGRDVPVLANLSPLDDLDGQVVGGMCLYLDMTELKEREAQITHQNECLGKAAFEAHEISDRLAAAAQQLSRAVASAREGAAEQQARTSETATAMEEMNATVGEVAQHAHAAAEFATRL